MNRIIIKRIILCLIALLSIVFLTSCEPDWRTDVEWERFPTKREYILNQDTEIDLSGGAFRYKIKKQVLFFMVPKEDEIAPIPFYEVIYVSDYDDVDPHSIPPLALVSNIDFSKCGDYTVRYYWTDKYLEYSVKVVAE